METETKIYFRRPTCNGKSYYINLPSALAKRLGYTTDTKLKIKLIGQTIMIRATER
jgi:antitoxin component of MazEF toxin-antitoxin module